MFSLVQSVLFFDKYISSCPVAPLSVIVNMFCVWTRPSVPPGTLLLSLRKRTLSGARKRHTETRTQQKCCISCLVISLYPKCPLSPHPQRLIQSSHLYGHVDTSVTGSLCCPPRERQGSVAGDCTSLCVGIWQQGRCH